jgi:Cdc6-like AAA superfamily ATPase
MKTEMLRYEDSQQLAALASKVFQPRTPIATKELFAGRGDELTTIADAVNQSGLHVVIYGERGVGKTSLSNVVKPTIWALDGVLEGAPHRLVVKAVAATGDTFATIWEKLFREITWQDNKPTIGLVPGIKSRTSLMEAFSLRGNLDIDNVRRTLTCLPSSVFIIDEFDRTAKTTSREFTDLIKALSDFAVDTTIILVGVSETVDHLVADHASVSRALIQIPLPRMKQEELRAILTYAEENLSISFSDEAASLIVHMSQGLPHYAHLIGLHSVRIAATEQYSRHVERSDVFSALKLAVKQAEQTTTDIYSRATHSAHKDALYKHVLLACAVTAAKCHDALGYFNPAAVIAPLSAILGRNVEIATFNSHLREFAQEKRGNVLERHGESRGYRFRFRDPLLVPFVFMNSIANDFVSDDKLVQLIA